LKQYRKLCSANQTLLHRLEVADGFPYTFQMIKTYRLLAMVVSGL